MIWLLLLACSKGESEDSPTELLGPDLAHTPSAAAVLVGESIPVTVTAEDPDGVGELKLYYRTEGGAFWNTLELLAADGGREWTGEIPGSEVTSPAMTYYIRAVDLGEFPATSFLPEDPDPNAFSVEVQVIGEPLPFAEDFELDEVTSDLWGLGWAQDSLEFRGSPWALSGSRAASGETSIAHLRSSDETKVIDDYLIAPALDFGAAERTQVTWMEFGQLSEDAEHDLWVSTGSRIPSDGDFVKWVDLTPPSGDDFGRSVVVDLSDLAGERAVYLAWRYAGAANDDWYIDDVAVEALTVDLSPSVSWSPSPVHPGESTTLILDLENLVDLAGGPLTVELSFPSGGASLASSVVEVPSIAALGSASAEFELTVDSEWPDNSRLPLQFSIVEGDKTWVFAEEFLVGVESSGQVILDLDLGALIQVELGVGDPDAPIWSETVYSGEPSVGTLAVDVDLTERFDLLPPDPSQRWYAKVSGDAVGEMESFTLSYGGVEYSVDVLPAILGGGTEAFAYVPEPPSPVLTLLTTTPSTVQPGDTVDLVIELTNKGADSAGAVLAELTSSDSELTVVAGGPKNLSDDSWLAGTTRTLDGFQLQVSEDHVDSTSVVADLDLNDDLESWKVPISLSVPWPVLRITSIEIDDRTGGDNDGLLEPGETADLDIEVTNLGDQGATGLVSAVLSLQSSSTASTTVDESSTLLGSLGVGVSQDKDFEVSVDSGASLGDTVDLLMTMTDTNGVEYTSEAQIVLGEAPWLYVSTANDSIGDSVGSYTVDLVNARYRVSGGVFELEYLTASAFDTSTAFIEMWAVASSGDYAFYRLSLQGTSAKLQGYDSAFVTLAKPTVTYPDSSTVRLAWNEADMGIGSTQFRAGFGAGWCGSDTGSFCDHFPDNWGYYYTGYDQSNFYSLRW